MRALSQAGLTLIERWEELVLYVYDDKVPKRRGSDGKLAYPEWDGGAVRGTLTTGYGHTDAAGAPKITKGMRITEAQANQILDQDLMPCQRAVNVAVTAAITQHQFDALVSFTFNCGEGSLAQLVKSSGINAGHVDAVPAHLAQYVNSKGERMQGLVNRRNAEIALWNTPDDPEAAAQHQDASPKGEQEPAPKTMAQSKTGWAAIVATVTALGSQLGQAVDAVRPLLQDEHTVALVCLIALGAGAFIWWDRRQKLTINHV